VALLEPGHHIGGMTTGGLGRTDYGNQRVIGGMSLDFYKRLGKHYGEEISWFFEPHVAEQALMDWLKEAGVEVLFEHRVDKVEKEGNRIVSVTMENGAGFTAKVFMDAGYEGDLLPRSGITYTWGREGREVYGESLAGRIEFSDKHQFDFPVNPYDEAGELLPLIYPGEGGEVGEGDRKVQAYNFRVCVTDIKENQVPFPKPEGYDPGRYAILERYLAQAGELEMNDLMIVSMMPNRKTDINNRGPISTDHIGASWEYPEADYAERERIWKDHEDYVQGFFYFLANDPSVPEKLQAEVNRWGLAKDEFVDTGHWPHQLYVREARRMIGEYVMRQKDLQTERTKEDSIGMGSYNSDSHHVQRLPVTQAPVWEGEVPGLINEGDMQVPVQPYEISYRCLTPKKEECVNLFVLSAFSASHVAYSSMRMEPQYMILGHAAGVAANMAIQGKTAIQDIDVQSLRNRLREQNQILSLSDVPSLFPNLPGVVMDNTEAEVSGEWDLSDSVYPLYGFNYLHDKGDARAENRIQFIPKNLKPGRYEVRFAYTSHENRASNAKVMVDTDEGPVTFLVDETKSLGKDAPFYSLGVFNLGTGSTGKVEITAEGADGYVVADAVNWVPLE
jgi:hypothetical protein